MKYVFVLLLFLAASVVPAFAQSDRSFPKLTPLQPSSVKVVGMREIEDVVYGKPVEPGLQGCHPTAEIPGVPNIDDTLLRENESADLLLALCLEFKPELYRVGYRFEEDYWSPEGDTTPVVFLPSITLLAPMGARRSGE